ncbi:MAG TPA: cupin domain-containing protein [Acidocella sp.]|nr:cupin domain-containing protein [Acidocella sp.]HQU03311.1 cupin domain-containing protein [Acidocella sp.]
MTGLYDRNAANPLGDQALPEPAHDHPHHHDHSHAHEGHNHPPGDGAKWDRWAKERVFVRALKGTYSNLYEQLIDQPRVYKSRDEAWKGGPGLYGKHIISPQHASVTQSIETHIEAYAPGAYGQKHGHLNSAVFYVIEGRGHDVHDGRRIEWKAGDVMIVENGCVHQHFNDDPDNRAVLLVFKAKPLFHFMHLIFQKIVSFPPSTGNEDFRPPSDL